MMLNKNEFAKKLVKLRNECGLSQNRLAEMLCVSGQAVSKWENAVSMPDVDLLLPLSQILGVSVDSMLGNEKVEFVNNAQMISEALVGFDIPDESLKILSAISRDMPRETLCKAAKLVEKGVLSYNITLDIVSSIDGKTDTFSKKVNVSEMELSTIEAFAHPLSSLTLQAVNKHDNPVRDILGLLACPWCGEALEYYKTADEEFLSCGKHKFRITEGVTDFGTFEQHGNTWSSWLRSYSDYKAQRMDALGNLNKDELYEKYSKAVDSLINEMKKIKPSNILEVGSGMASYAWELVKAIDWPCTLILTDISHRILKYDKRFMEEDIQNPNVKIIYIACDALHLPFKSNSIDCVTSFGGFENYNDSSMAGIKEAYRILKPSGNCIYEMAAVLDRNAPSTMKWLHLIEVSDDSDAPGLLSIIFDISEWKKINDEVIGFKSCSITKLSDEAPAPETDKFPYDCEVMRWMAMAVITAEK